MRRLWFWLWVSGTVEHTAWRVIRVWTYILAVPFAFIAALVYGLWPTVAVCAVLVWMDVRRRT
jgi:hypothetical protein